MRTRSRHTAGLTGTIFQRALVAQVREQLKIKYNMTNADYEVLEVLFVLGLR